LLFYLLDAEASHLSAIHQFKTRPYRVPVRFSDIERYLLTTARLSDCLFRATSYFILVFSAPS
jgi:hypothetical protein